MFAAQLFDDASRMFANNFAEVTRDAAAIRVIGPVEAYSYNGDETKPEYIDAGAGVAVQVTSGGVRCVLDHQHVPGTTPNYEDSADVHIERQKADANPAAYPADGYDKAQDCWSIMITAVGGGDPILNIKIGIDGSVTVTREDGMKSKTIMEYTP